MSDEQLYEPNEDGVFEERPWWRRQLGRISRHRLKAAVAGSAMLAIYMALGADDAADRERDRLAQIFAEELVCQLQGGPDCQTDALDGVIIDREPLGPPERYQPNPPLAQPPADFVIPEPQTALASSTAEPDPELIAEIARLEERLETAQWDIADLQTDLDAAVDDNDAYRFENTQLRSALAAARANATDTDSAINAAVIEAIQQTEARYADQVCFSRPDWDAYRLDLNQLCAGGGR